MVIDMKAWAAAIFLLAAAACVERPARAQEGGAVSVGHVPLSEAKPGKSVEISADVKSDWKIEELLLYVRKIGESGFKKVKFALSSSGSYVAVVKGENVSYPGFEYAIWVKEKGGEGRFAFASASEPHPVLVSRMSWKDIRRLLLLANRGTTSTFFGDFVYSRFGKQEKIDGLTGNVETSAIDQFYRGEFGYSYRILTVLYAFYFGFGMVRGSTLKDNRRQDVGIDYGFAKLLFQFHRYIALEPKIVFGGSEEGFEWGGGAVLRLGNTLETHADIGFEIISTVGSTVLVKFMWDTVPGFMMGLGAELTDFPSSSAWGTRLYFEVDVIAFKHLYFKGIAGYAARSSKTGGPILGYSMNVNF
jgi:hypothetical protein